MPSLVKFTINEGAFGKQIQDLAGASLRSFAFCFQEQARLLCKELIDRTPPFSGKRILKMFRGRQEFEAKLGQGFSDQSLLITSFGSRGLDYLDENPTAKAVGERRVEKDIRRVILGVRDATPPANRRPQVFIGQTHEREAGYDPNAVEWGVLQNCQGKPAVYIFATTAGQVYGVDLNDFKPNASDTELGEHHQQARQARGRVGNIKSKLDPVGRWNWLNVITTKETAVKAYIEKKKKAVGQAKGGWAAGFMALGGRMSKRGWVGRHSNSGTFVNGTRGNHLSFTIINNSKWASDGDPDRVIEAAMQGRAEAMAGNIKRVLTKVWGNKSGQAGVLS